MSNVPSFHNYLSNGRNGENIPIKSTKIKSGNKGYLATNGRLFNKTYKKQLLNKNLILALKKTDKKDLVSWVVETLNPINHIPVINTLNKLNKDKKNSLDMVQSAIGGIIYGGGVGGIAKGLGGWFTGKLLPKNIITADSKLEKNKNLILMDNGRITKNNNMLKKATFEGVISGSNKVDEFNKSSEKNSNKIDIIHIEKKSKNYDNFYDKNKKLNKTIDTKA
ncbi:hypothetical protein N9R86_04330 [Alphaproteobacteria bacterium]|nr:hypothetical protein [Alphaproteobacteria bacterium]